MDAEKLCAIEARGDIDGISSVKRVAWVTLFTSKHLFREGEL
jgi:hypothetical protein